MSAVLPYSASTVDNDTPRTWWLAGPWVWKLLVFVPLLVLLTSLVVLGLAVRANNEVINRHMTAQQSEEIDLLAKLMASKLEQSQKVLVSVAEGMAPWALDSRPSIEWIVQQGLPAARYFDSLVFAQGNRAFRLNFRNDQAEGPQEVDPAERDLLRRIMVDGKPLVSEPIKGSGGEPSIAFGMPLRDKQGVLHGALAGVLRLQSQSLLPMSLSVQPGADSKLVVMTTSGTIIAHPDPQRILGQAKQEPELADALALWVQRAAPAAKSSPIALWSEPYLVSMAEIPSARWLVARVVNRDKLLPPALDTRKRTVVQISIAIACAMLLAVAWLLWHTRRLRALSLALRQQQGVHTGAKGLLTAKSALPFSGDDDGATDEIAQISRYVQQLQRQRQDSAHALARESSVSQAMMGNAPLGILLLNGEHITDVSQALAHILGHETSDLIGQHIRSLTTDVEALTQTIAELHQDLLRHGFGEAHAMLRHQSGAGVRAQIQVFAVDGGTPGQTLCFVQASGFKVSAAHGTSPLDKLTQLPNYDALFLHLMGVLQTAQDDDGQALDASGASTVLFYVNIDNMSAINALAGHAQGDQVIRYVARQLQLLQPYQGFVARVAGDKFALVLRHCTRDKALEQAKQLCKTIDDWQPELRGRHFAVSISVGLLAVDERFLDAQAVIRAADMACYAAKRAGGNGAHWDSALGSNRD